MSRKVLQPAKKHTYLRTDVLGDAGLCEARRTVILIKESHQGEGDDCQ